MNKIYITIKDGMLTGVFSEEQVEVHLIDYDNIAVDEDADIDAIEEIEESIKSLYRCY